MGNVKWSPHGPSGEWMAYGATATALVGLDRFTDRGTGKVIRLEIRLTRIVVREGGEWKIAGRE